MKAFFVTSTPREWATEIIELALLFGAVDVGKTCNDSKSFVKSMISRLDENWR